MATAARTSPQQQPAHARPRQPAVSSIIYSIMRAFLAILATVGGLHGFVQKGPIVPVCRAGEPCTAPAQVTLLFRASRVYRTRSGADGPYRITLPRGYYTVTTLERIGINRNIRPRTVHVRAGHVDRLDFAIDTGIR